MVKYEFGGRSNGDRNFGLPGRRRDLDALRLVLILSKPDRTPHPAQTQRSHTGHPMPGVRLSKATALATVHYGSKSCHVRWRKAELR